MYNLSLSLSIYIYIYMARIDTRSMAELCAHGDRVVWYYTASQCRIHVTSCHIQGGQTLVKCSDSDTVCMK